MPLASLVAAVATISGFLIASDTVVIAGALEFIDRDFALGTVAKGVGHCDPGWRPGGAVASGPIAGRIGQRRP